MYNLTMKISKKVGIIGGVGPQATNFIYSKIIEFSQKKYNARENADYPKIIIESVPVPDFISSKEKLDIAKEMLINATKSLSSAGATRLFIGSNTVHILLDELQKNTNVSFDSMVKLVSKHCVEKGFKKVGILGTPILISSNLYQEELKKRED